MLVAGFQGVSTAKDVTTLGRGGSDTTAVALAAAIGADVCEIYTDVAGVFSADPRVVPDARKLPVVSFEEMLEMSASGAGVLQLRSVEYARNHGVQIHCRSSFSDAPGTIVVRRGATGAGDRPAITAVTHSTDEARVTLEHVPNAPGMAGRIATALADANVNIDMIIQNEPVVAGRGRGHVVHRPARGPARSRSTSLAALAEELGIEITTDESVGKVSVIGEGMKTQSGVAAQVFSTLGEHEINIQMIATSPIKISCVIELDARARRRPRAARGVPARRSAVAFAGWSFTGQWRGYQSQCLEAFEADRAAGRHQTLLVAPPGSGKTVVGLEIVRRLGVPALVLCPSRTIQRQWGEKQALFGAGRAPTCTR